MRAVPNEGKEETMSDHMFIETLKNQDGHMTRGQAKRIVCTFAKRSRWHALALRVLVA